MSNTGADAFNEIVIQPLERDAGYLVVPDRPGIGVEIDESKLEKFPYKSSQISGNFGADGAVIH